MPEGRTGTSRPCRAGRRRRRTRGRCRSLRRRRRCRRQAGHGGADPGGAGGRRCADVGQRGEADRCHVRAVATEPASAAQLADPAPPARRRRWLGRDLHGRRSPHPDRRPRPPLAGPRPRARRRPRQRPQPTLASAPEPGSLAGPVRRVAEVVMRPSFVAELVRGCLRRSCRRSEHQRPRVRSTGRVRPCVGGGRYAPRGHGPAHRRLHDLPGPRRRVLPREPARQGPVRRACSTCAATTSASHTTDVHRIGRRHALRRRRRHGAAARADLRQRRGRRSAAAAATCSARVAAASTRPLARELAGRRGFSLLCGRYEGVDHRVRQHLVDGELSIGDYVLGGGEAAAIVVDRGRRPACSPA